MRMPWRLTPALSLVAVLVPLAHAPLTPARATAFAAVLATQPTPQAAMPLPRTVRHVFTPADMTWQPVPPSLPAGAQMIVLSGDPGASSGVFTVRIKVPDGYRIMPHTHPKRVHVAVLSGTLRLGTGERWDDASMKRLPAGSFAYMDPATARYAQMHGETMLQVHGESPLVLTYVNPAHAPSKKVATSTAR